MDTPTVWVVYRTPFPASRGRVLERLRAFPDFNEALAWANAEHDALPGTQGAHWEYGVSRFVVESWS